MQRDLAPSNLLTLNGLSTLLSMFIAAIDNWKHCMSSFRWQFLNWMHRNNHYSYRNFQFFLWTWHWEQLLLNWSCIVNVFQQCVGSELGFRGGQWHQNNLLRQHGWPTDLVFIIMRSRSTAFIFGGGTLIASQDTYAEVVVYLSHLMNPSYKCSLNILYIFGIKPLYIPQITTQCAGHRSQGLPVPLATTLL